jgi:hypothetical protein
MKLHLLLILPLLILGARAAIAADAPPQTAIQKEVRRLAIPESLMPTGEQPLFMFRAEGVQIYTADRKLQWVLQAPEAVLRDYRTGEKVGTHSKGPVWVDDKGSKLVATGKKSAPAPNADAVAWLLVDVRNENGGRFANVRHVQRVDTWAGLPPAAAPTKPGETVEARYEATYIFWGENR